LDPENLIALHHLGDIARQLGDVGAARGWYRRVLETDPRNEEIIQILAELEKPPAIAPQSADVQATSETVSVPPIPIAPTSISDQEIPVETPSLQPFGFEATNLAASEPSPEPPSVPAASETALEDLELVSLDETAEQPVSGQQHAAETAEIAETPVEAAAEEITSPEPERERALAETPPWEEAIASDVTAEEEVAFADGGASIPETNDSSSFESAALDAALFGDTTEMPGVRDAEGDADLSADATHQEGGDFERELDIFEAPASVPDVNALTIDAPLTPTPTTGASVFETDDAVETAPIDGGHDGQEVPAAPSEIFVTETMAELYLRQGHLESALDIYRRLVAQRPADPHLRDRFRAVEDLLYGKTVEIEAPTMASRGVVTPPTAAMPITPAAAIPVVETPAASSPSVDEAAESPTEIVAEEPPRERMATPGPTIRQFLAGILSRRPTPVVNESTNGNREADEEPAPPESLDTLFGGSASSESNTTAASALAEAFSPEDPDTNPLQGLPAHRATNELSLDHVFRTPAHGSDARSAFSFDRFFSEESIEEESPPAAEQPPATAGSAEDIAEFNAWLSGLKKT
jgi:hypothetical protein